MAAVAARRAAPIRRRQCPARSGCCAVPMRGADADFVV